MTTLDLIYPAVGVFSLLVIGLVLTVLDFVKADKARKAKKAKK